jgi:hypothetical protein
LPTVIVHNGGFALQNYFLFLKKKMLNYVRIFRRLFLWAAFPSFALLL